MKKYQFTATIQRGDGGGAYVLFPYDVETEFGTKGKVPVRATFNGVPYRGSLVKYGNPQHMLGVLKSIRDETGAGLGDSIEVELWKDEETRVVEVPPVFESAMKKAGVLPFFKSLSYTHQKEYCRWIGDAKRDETRARRAEQAIEMLRSRTKAP